MELFIGLIAGIAGSALVSFFVLRAIKQTNQPQAQQELLQTLQSNFQQLNQQSLQTLLQQFNHQQETAERRTGQLQGNLQQLQIKLAQIEEGNKRVLEMGKGITELQNILQAPKLRGNRGEIWLEELLTQMLGRPHFQMQYAFKSGEICDAVIKLRDGLLLPIDSKFSLENFKKMLNAEDPTEKKMQEKLFISDVKRRIDEIAKKYIQPAENTLNFAFMYIPAENVYYQAFIEDRAGNELQNYAFKNHVIPVSPNSLYPYLEIVLFGLRGLQIEQGAREIQQGLAGLNGDLTRFEEDYRKLGNNIRLAQQNFDSADKRLNTVQNKLETLNQRELIDGVTDHPAL